MSDWDEFEQECIEERRDNGLRCGMAKYLESLAPEARDAVQRALGRSELQAGAIRSALLKRGSGVPSAWTIRNHRRGDCRCMAEED